MCRLTSGHRAQLHLFKVGTCPQLSRPCCRKAYFLSPKSAQPNMSQSLPKVRSACEACHKRKQRCIPYQAGGPCHSCRQNARNCYFVPRIRPGKQRRDTLGLDRPDVAALSDSGAAQAPSDTASPFPGLGAHLDSFYQDNTQPRLASAVVDLDDNRDDQNDQNGQVEQGDLDSFWDPGFVDILRVVRLR